MMKRDRVTRSETGRQRASRHAIPAFAAVALMVVCRPVHAQSQAEQLVERSIEAGQTADLTTLPDGQRTLGAASLVQLLGKAQPNARSITIRGAEIGDASPINDETGSLDVPNSVRLEQCHFAKRLQLANCHFHGGLAFVRCRFDGGVDLSGSTVDGDLLLGEIVISAAPEKQRAMLLTDMRIGGELFLGRPRIEGGIAAGGVTARELNVNLAGARVGEVSFSHLTADSAVLSSGGKAEAELPLVAMPGATVKDVLVLRGLVLRNLNLSLANVAGTASLENVRVVKELNFSGATLGSFRWTLAAPLKPGPVWPGSMLFAGFTFQNAMVQLPPPAAGTVDSDDLPPADIGDTLRCFMHAHYSQSAFQSLEAELTRQGEIPDAEDVFFAMHHANRAAAWTWNPATWPWGVFDFFQEYVLGYERSVLTPLVWALVFVICGTNLFRRSGAMTPAGEGGKAPAFSAAWYSLELFLPVVDLGMAKSWRPANRSLQAYARVQQIAGWVLVPVALAAATGVTH